MAPGSRGSLAALLSLAVVAGACSSAGSATTDPAPSTTEAAPTTTTTVAATTTTTSRPTTTSTSETTTTSSGATVEVDAVVKVPEGAGPFPAVVLVHGGGWVVGEPSSTQPLANMLTDAGYLTVNTSYQLSSFETAGYPAAVDDVACAVRFARSHPDSDGTVAIIGHSAGAHLGALVSLTGDDYGDGCATGVSAVPERLIGLAGPYDTDRLGVAVLLFFGAGPELIPEAWASGNPQLQTDRNPDIESLIMYGELDGLVDASFAIDFHNALVDSGATSLLELVEGARHSDMDDPDWVGDLIVTWLDR